ncbi:MAG: DUF447 family protein [Methanobacterium sp.]|jgi:hypothetical protein
MQDLTGIKMERGLLYETIITTKNDDGTPNAAPIGVLCKNESQIVLYLFEGTHTLHNIKSNGRLIVNILKDPVIFTESIVGELSPDYFKMHENDFYIKNTDAFFTAAVTNVREVQKNDDIGNSKLNIITADVGEIIIKNKNVEPLNRAIYAVIESLVYLSRIKMVDDKTAANYLERINEMSKVVSRTGSLEHKKAMVQILNSLKEILNSAP